MAKMFYTLDEAAKKLSKTADQVKKMVESGQLQEFRDGDKLVVKREQIEAMTADETDAPISLADSGELSLTDSAGGSGTGAGESTKERSGISIFEADELDNTADASAQTQVTQSVGGIRVPDAGGSGSGLLDLTRDSSDDTGVGAGLMQDIYNSSDSADEAVPAGGGRSGGALFESTGVNSDMSAAAPMMVYAEQIDGVGSGLAGGLAFGMIAALLLALFAVIAGLAGAGAAITGMGTGMFWGLIGAAAGVTLIGAGLGAFIGSRNK